MVNDMGVRDENTKDALTKCAGSCLTLSEALESGNVAALRDMLNKGHSPENYEWDDRSTPLIRATQKKNLEVMSILLQHGANISKKHRDGYTAVHVASIFGFLKGLELLSSHGADFREPDSDNITPLSLASSEGHVDAVHYLFHKVNSIESVPANCPLTPLVMAALKNQVDVLNFLLHAQDRSEYQEFELNQALIRATLQGHEEVVRVLLKHGANPNCQADLPPIHAAIHRGHQNILEILCNNGADIEIRDGRNFTPLEAARSKGNAQATEYLEHLCKLVACFNHDGNTHQAPPKRRQIGIK